MPTVAVWTFKGSHELGPFGLTQARRGHPNQLLVNVVGQLVASEVLGDGLAGDWVDKDFPGEAEVGSVHCAPNSESDYDGNNPNAVWTNANDWLTYPNLPRQKKQLNAVSGGWDGIVNHHQWWMKHLPHNPGVTESCYNNWWQYIVNYDEALQKLPPPEASFLKAKRAMYAD